LSIGTPLFPHIHRAALPEKEFCSRFVTVGLMWIAIFSEDALLIVNDEQKLQLPQFSMFQNYLAHFNGCCCEHC